MFLMWDLPQDVPVQTVPSGERSVPHFLLWSEEPGLCRDVNTHQWVLLKICGFIWIFIAKYKVLKQHEQMIIFKISKTEVTHLSKDFLAKLATNRAVTNSIPFIILYKLKLPALKITLYIQSL